MADIQKRRAKSLRQQIAAAHEATRAALNELHAVRQVAQAAVNDQDQTRYAYEAAAAERDRLKQLLAVTDRLSDAEMVALSAVVMTEQLPITDARKKLVEQLRVRGVLR